MLTGKKIIKKNAFQKRKETNKQIGILKDVTNICCKLSWILQKTNKMKSKQTNKQEEKQNSYIIKIYIGDDYYTNTVCCSFHY